MRYGDKDRNFSPYSRGFCPYGTTDGKPFDPIEAVFGPKNPRLGTPANCSSEKFVLFCHAQSPFCTVCVVSLPLHSPFQSVGKLKKYTFGVIFTRICLVVYFLCLLLQCKTYTTEIIKTYCASL